MIAAMLPANSRWLSFWQTEQTVMQEHGRQCNVYLALFVLLQNVTKGHPMGNQPLDYSTLQMHLSVKDNPMRLCCI